MSHSTTNSKNAARFGYAGLPTWAGPAVVLAALITGVLLSLNEYSLGKVYLGCFVASTILVAICTQARGLFLTVASVPLIFGGTTFVSSLAFSRMQAPNGSDFSKTSLVTSVFPVVQFFPTLIWVMVAATAIAVLRVWLLKRNLARYLRATEKERQLAAEMERRNLETANIARRVGGINTIPTPSAPGTLAATPKAPHTMEAAPKTAPGVQFIPPNIAANTSSISNATAAPSPNSASSTPRERRQQQAERRRQALQSQAPAQLQAQEREERRGRRYVEPGDSSRITVEELLARNKNKRRSRRPNLHRDLYED